MNGIFYIFSLVFFFNFSYKLQKIRIVIYRIDKKIIITLTNETLEIVKRDISLLFLNINIQKILSINHLPNCTTRKRDYFLVSKFFPFFVNTYE